MRRWLLNVFAVLTLPLTVASPAGAGMGSNKILDEDWVVGQHSFDATLRVDRVDACVGSVLGVSVQQWGRQHSAAPSNKIFLYHQQGPTGAAGCAPVEQVDYFTSMGGPLVELSPSAVDISPNRDTVHVVADVTATDVTFGHGTTSFHVDITFHSTAAQGDQVATVTGSVTGAGRTWLMDSERWGLSWEAFGNGAPFAFISQTVNSPFGVVGMGNERSLFESKAVILGG